jgi:hypothetical protein
LAWATAPAMQTVIATVSVVLLLRETHVRRVLTNPFLSGS